MCPASQCHLASPYWQITPCLNKHHDSASGEAIAEAGDSWSVHKLADDRPAPTLPPADDDDGLTLLLLPARYKCEPLQQYKTVCDELLPELRTNLHLSHLIQHRKENYSFVLRDRDGVLGGATFHMALRSTANGAADLLVLEVLLLAVGEGAGRKGHGTRLINAAKTLLAAEAATTGTRSVLLTQSDDGETAQTFWKKQQLRKCEQASALVHALHDWEKKRHLVYNHTVAMCFPIDASSAEGGVAGTSMSASEDMETTENASPSQVERTREHEPTPMHTLTFARSLSLVLAHHGAALPTLTGRQSRMVRMLAQLLRWPWSRRHLMR